MGIKTVGSRQYGYRNIGPVPGYIFRKNVWLTSFLTSWMLKRIFKKSYFAIPTLPDCGLESAYLSYLRNGYGHSYIFKPLSLTRGGGNAAQFLPSTTLALGGIFVFLAPAADSHTFGF